LIGDEIFEFKFLSHFDYFFYYKNYWTTFGRKKKSTTHEELELGSQFKPELELGFFSFFFVAGVIELLLRPKVVQWHMKNSSSCLCPISNLDFKLGFYFLFFCCRHF
jgi:hypothetical protein